jgi:hypothetical protein
MVRQCEGNVSGSVGRFDMQIDKGQQPVSLHLHSGLYEVASAEQYAWEHRGGVGGKLVA